MAKRSPAAVTAALNALVDAGDFSGGRMEEPMQLSAENGRLLGGWQRKLQSK